MNDHLFRGPLMSVFWRQSLFLPCLTASRSFLPGSE